MGAPLLSASLLATSLLLASCDRIGRKFGPCDDELLHEVASSSGRFTASVSHGGHSSWGEEVSDAVLRRGSHHRAARIVAACSMSLGARRACYA